MGFLSHLLYPWGLLLQGLRSSTSSGDGRRRIGFTSSSFSVRWAHLSILRRGASRHWNVPPVFKVFPRRKRIVELETMVRDNPSAAKLRRARRPLYGWRQAGAGARRIRQSYRRTLRYAGFVLPARSLRPQVRRCRSGFTGPGTSRRSKIQSYDFHRAAGLLARACAQAGQKEKAETLFRKATLPLPCRRLT